MKHSTTIDALNTLLADTHIMNVKLHNYHWNIQGSQFFSIHEMTEKFYDHFFSVFDDIAERILQLEGKPMTTVKSYLKNATLLEETLDSFSAEYVLEALLKDFSAIHKSALRLIELAEESNDLSTGNLIGDLIDWLEKSNWMIRQTLA